MWPFKKKTPVPAAHHVAGVPPGRVLKRFVALTDFYAPETKSTYCAGMGYSVREGSEGLATHVNKWVSEGKVSWQ